jgi:hypothetical protein
MKVSLSVLERLIALGLFPAENNYATLKVIRTAKDILGFSDEENKLLKFQNTEINGKPMMKWEDGVVADREFELGEKAVDLISERLKELNKDRKLNNDMISMYDKFVGNQA